MLTEIKSAVKKTVGRKKAKQLLEAAQNSIGVDYGESSAVFRIKQYMTELEMIENQLVEVEEEMNVALEKTGLSEYLLSIPGAGVVSMASVLGEMGDPLRFENPRQMSRMAGYNLIEDSSGKNKSGTCISKRGRKNLRCVLYKMALTMVAVNSEMKQLYSYLKTSRWMSRASLSIRMSAIRSQRISGKDSIMRLSQSMRKQRIRAMKRQGRMPRNIMEIQIKTRIKRQHPFDN